MIKTYHVDSISERTQLELPLGDIDQPRFSRITCFRTRNSAGSFRIRSPQSERLFPPSTFNTWIRCAYRIFLDFVISFNSENLFMTVLAHKYHVVVSLREVWAHHGQRHRTADLSCARPTGREPRCFAISDPCHLRHRICRASGYLTT